jgi:hypothetical protein
MTLRQALKKANLNEVYRLINEKDCSYEDASKNPPLDTTVRAYTRVVNELLSKPKTKANKHPWLIQESTDTFDGKKYADVCFLNPKYVAPKKGLKPWGGMKGKKLPKGHYDCNADKHNRTFAAGFTPWSKVIDTPIINDAGYSLEKALAELLWELTFYGWSESKVKENVKEIEGRIDEAVKEIKEGKCVELPPSKEGGLKIVIPDSVSQQLIDIANKKKKNK